MCPSFGVLFFSHLNVQLNENVKHSTGTCECFQFQFHRATCKCSGNVKAIKKIGLQTNVKLHYAKSYRPFELFVNENYKL